MHRSDWPWWLAGAALLLVMFTRCDEASPSDPGYPEDCIIEYWQTGPSCG